MNTPQTRASYDRLSRWYDLLAGSSERSSRELGLRKLDVKPGERVLEIGSGTGQALAGLCEAGGPLGVAWGLDLSRGMCQVARRRGARFGRPGFRLVCGDAAAIPVADRSFDAAFMSFTLELFPPSAIAQVLSESARILRPGGRLGVVSLADDGRAGPMQQLYAWAHRSFPTWVDCRPIQVAEIVSSSGFHVLDVTTVGLWGLPVEIVVAANAK